jgi:hypothetical protein
VAFFLRLYISFVKPLVGQREARRLRMVLARYLSVSAFRAGTGAGFYSSFGGPLPWVINKIPPERYYAVETR